MRPAWLRRIRCRCGDEVRSWRRARSRRPAGGGAAGWPWRPHRQMPVGVGRYPERHDRRPRRWWLRQAQTSCRWSCPVLLNPATTQRRIGYTVYSHTVYHAAGGGESMGLRRLRGVDAYVWYNQTPTNHMHTLKVAILDTAGASVPYSAERFISELNDRLHRIPSFRWLLRETPLGLHHPVWVEDPDFDIARHVLRTKATSPGGPRERDELIGKIAETPLPT